MTWIAVAIGIVIVVILGIALCSRANNFGESRFEESQ